MGIFGRMSDILTANINDLLDRAEDPEKMLKQVIREMEDAVQGAKRNVAQVLAGQKKLEKEAQTNKRLVDEWQAKAEQAMEAGREDLARTALKRKREYQELVATLDQQHASGQGTADTLKQTLRGLEAKLADAKRHKMMLAARKKTAQAELAAHDRLGGADGRSGQAAFGKFERFEEQVDDLEAEAAAMKELSEEDTAVETEFEDLEADAHLEIEMEELRRKTKKKGKGGQ
jgi:phage shock protein A